MLQNFWIFLFLGILPIYAWISQVFCFNINLTVNYIFHKPFKLLLEKSQNCPNIGTSAQVLSSKFTKDKCLFLIPSSTWCVYTHIDITYTYWCLSKWINKQSNQQNILKQNLNSSKMYIFFPNLPASPVTQSFGSPCLLSIMDSVTSG